MAPDLPEYDVSGSQAAGVEADVETLAQRRAIESAARLGTQYVAPGQTTIQKQRIGTVTLPSGQKVQYKPEEWQEGGTYAQEYPMLASSVQKGKNVSYRTVKAPYTAPDTTYDFTGLGEADIQSKQARQMAEKILQISEEYGPQYIEERLKELQQADPEGYAARKQLYQLIQDDLEQAGKEERPVAETLEQRILTNLRSGTGLAPDVKAQTQEQIAAASAARGGGTAASAADITGSLETGVAGEARKTARQRVAMEFLGGGLSAEDTKYRREQQAMSNMGSFLAGQTPTSQFSQLAGAQQGAAPIAQAPALSTVNQNAGAQGNSYGMSTYNTGVQALSQQANPWMAGISLALQGAGAAGAAGWSPLGTSTKTTT